MVLVCTHSPAQANREEKILLPLKDELPPRHLTFIAQESFHLDRDQSSPHTVAQCPAVTRCTLTLLTNWGNCHRDNPRLQGGSSFPSVRKSTYIHNFSGIVSTAKPKPLPFFAGFLLLFSCPLTSCNRFSSSFFFSWANSSFDFAACFFPLAAVEEERTISETARLQAKKSGHHYFTGHVNLCNHSAVTLLRSSDHTATTHPRQRTTYDVV